MLCERQLVCYKKCCFNLELYGCACKGKIKFTNEEGTKKIIEELTGKFESETSAAAFNKLPGRVCGQACKGNYRFYNRSRGA